MKHIAPGLGGGGQYHFKPDRGGADGRSTGPALRSDDEFPFPLLASYEGAECCGPRSGIGDLKGHV